MDLLVTACLVVLSAAVVVIGIMLTGMASDLRKTRQALENSLEHWSVALSERPAESASSRSLPNHAELAEARTAHSDGQFG